MSRANSTEDLHVDDKEGHAGEAAAALGKEPLKKTATKEEEEEHDLLRGQLHGRWGTAAAPQHPTLSLDDKPLMDAAASPLFLKVYNNLDEQQRQDTQTEQTAPAASGLSGKVSPGVEVLALKSDEVEGRLDDNGLYGAPASPSSSCSPSASFSFSSFVSSSACARSNYVEQKGNDLRRVMSNSSPSSHRRAWLCRTRSATSSVCGTCGTPFEICVRGDRNYLGRTPCPALPNNPSDLTPPVLHAELTHDVPAIGERRNGEPVQSSGATIPAAGKRATAGSCVPATAVSARGALAPSATATTVEDAACDYGNGSRYDASGSHSEINCKFSPNASTYSNYSRLAKQQRLPVLQIGDGHEKRRLSTQPLPVARLAVFRRPCHNPQEDVPAGGGSATYCLLGKGGRKDSTDVDTEENKREGGPPQEKLHDLFGASVPPEDGDVGTAKCDEAFADCGPSYEAYSSSSLASSSSCSVLSSSSASSASPAPAPSATSATASSTSGARRFNSKAERRRADSRRDRCRSVSSTRGSSSVERATLTRTGSNSCTNSTCVNSTGGSRPGTRFCGRRYFYYCCASYLGFTWGWTFQRQPPATWRDYVGELKCGVAVALSQLPATMTCAIVANVPVTSALHGAWITGLITAIFGGSPSSVTTVTSSLAVTLAKVTRTVCDEKTNTCTDEGLEFIFPALILAGACCLLLGTLRLSRFSQFVPSATIVGYLNAVAILNVKAQVVTLKFDPVTSTGYEWLWVLLMITTVFVIMCTWENIPKIRINALVPASVLALAVSSFIEFVLVRGVCGMQTKTVAALSMLTNKDEGGDTKEHIQGDASSMWPKPFFRTPSNVQPFNFYFRLQDLLTMLELTLALVMVNYMSTLVTLDMLSDKSSHLHLDSKPDQHLVSVGFANIVACFLGALPGSTAPFPSLLSLKLGSKSREGAVIAALVNLAFVAASPYFLDLVPLGGLAGIIMYTAYHAFQWRTVAAVFASFLPERLRMKHPVLQRKICRSDAFVMLLTTSVALCVDIGTAILSGVCIASCVFAWKNAARLQVLSRLDVEAGVKFYRVKGPIFFLTKRRLLRYFDVEKDPVSVILELSDEAEQLFDYGALETLDALAMRYRRANKRLKVVGMQCGDRKMIVKAGRLFEFAQIELVEKSLGDSASVKSIADMMKLPC